MAGGSSASALARWDGTTWSPYQGGIASCCSQASVSALTPKGDSLLVGGTFGKAGTVETFNITAWDGVAWSGELSSSGSGLSASGRAMVGYNGSLVVGGNFHSAGGSEIWSIAQWDGGTWSGLGSGMNSTVSALTVFQGDLIAGGGFTAAGGTPAYGIARWDGTSWHPLGSGVNASVWALTVWNGDLYAGGSFSQAGGQPASRIARWNGTSWNILGPGVGPSGAVKSLAGYDSVLVVGGNFATAGGIDVHSIAGWDGSNWSPLGSGFRGLDLSGYPFTPDVKALVEYEGELIAAGDFTEAGGVRATNVARWNGAEWDSLGNPPTVVFTTCIHEGNLFIGAGFGPEVAYWDGEAWESLGSGVNPGWANAMTSYEGSLYVTGGFQTVGNKPALHIARWTANRTAVEDVPGPILLQVSPNPVTSQADLHYHVRAPGQVSLTLYDIAGRRVATILDEFRTSGNYRQSWDRRVNGHRLPAGVYYLVLNSATQRDEQKLIIVK